MASIDALSKSEQKLVSQTKFPKEYDVKVSMSKVKLDVIKPVIISKLKELIGDDDIVFDFAIGLLEQNEKPDIRVFQIQMSGFLGDKAQEFSLELWKLLIRAQENPHGIPPEMIEAKKQQLAQDRSRRQQQQRPRSDTSPPRDRYGRRARRREFSRNEEELHDQRPRQERQHYRVIEQPHSRSARFRRESRSRSRSPPRGSDRHRYRSSSSPRRNIELERDRPMRRRRPGRGNSSERRYSRSPSNEKRYSSSDAYESDEQVNSRLRDD